jgi:hypothetical protein
VAAAVPVVTGVQQQRACGLPTAPGQRGPSREEFGVVEREVIEGPVVVSRATEPLLRPVDPR